MAAVHSSLTWSQSDAIAEVLSAKSCDIVQVESPPDYVEKISRYLESSTGQSKQDKISNEPAEAESDSGDNLFITQKPVPEAVRSKRRLHRNLRSTPASPRDLEESGSNTSSSSSDGESKTDRKSRRKKYRLPKYTFPFLSGRGWKPTSTELPVRQNIGLHNSAMVGFFKCVRETWQGYQRGDEGESWLPTVDTDGEYISPLSEEEEEMPEDEDIKVVENKCFLAPSKQKNRQIWCNQLKQQKKGKAGNTTSCETPPGRQCKTLKIPANARMSRASPLSLDTESTVGEESSCRVWDEGERNDDNVTGHASFLAHQETPKSKRCLNQENKKVHFQQKDTEDELCDDSDATVCELNTPQGSPRLRGRGGSTTATTITTEPHTDDVPTNDLSQTGQTEDEFESQSLLQSLPDLFSDSNNDRVCIDTRVKKRKHNKGDHESTEQEKGQSQEEPEGLHAAKSVIMDEEETPRLSEVSCNVENDGKEVKKKKKRKRIDDDVERLQCSTAVKSLNDGAEIQMKKKKVEKMVVAEECEQEKESNKTLDLLPVSTEQLKESRNGLEITTECEETLESSYVKRKKHKKKQQSFSNDGEEGVDVSSNDAVTLVESTGTLLKKKKKKKKKSMCEEADISDDHEESKKTEDGDGTQRTKEGLEDQNTEQLSKKKKRKNKISENSSENISEDLVVQSDDSVSARKKEKRRTSSFLVADVEEKDAQTHGEQNSPSQSEAHVCAAEKLPVSTADFETESAEISGNLEQSSAGVRKKKKKMNMSVEQESVERDHKQEFEAPNNTCQSPASETTDTGVKRKKKQKRNESELMTPMEKLESAADEAAVFKKKKKKKKKKCKDEPCHVIQESPAAAATEESESEKSLVNTCSSASPNKKGKHMTFPSVAQSNNGCSTGIPHDGIPHDGHTSDQATEEALNMVEQASSCSETPGNQALNSMRQKKKKKKVKSPDSFVPEGTECAELEAQESKKKEKKKRNKESSVLGITSSSPVLNEISLSKPEKSEPVMKNKHKKVKRTLHNANEDFLTD